VAVKVFALRGSTVLGEGDGCKTTMTPKFRLADIRIILVVIQQNVTVDGVVD
jgi:hypothetical protein